jgi:hypothetical protein
MATHSILLVILQVNQSYSVAVEHVYDNIGQVQSKIVVAAFLKQQRDTWMHIISSAYLLA